ncbi:MAG TPA: beta-propeller fold lactonase family protein, partial [Candidatus Krumholzibacteria bacterium]|nr:beta-propeller fold lactonase family protein [Candidatus Krumholzibacteria bacterium]
DNELNDLTLFDARFASQDGIPTLIGPLSLAANVAMDAEFHPSGRALYVSTASPEGVQVFDTDTSSPGFGNSVQFFPVDVVGNPPTSFDLDARPNGLMVFGDLVESTTGVTQLFGFVINDLNHQIEFLNQSVVDTGTPAFARALRIVPNGNRGVRASSDGFEQFDLDLPYLPIDPTIGAEDNTEANEFDFTPDGTRMYVASPLADRVRMYDFAADGAMVAVSGNNQTGVAGSQLAAPIRVRVTAPGSTFGLPGIPVSFEAQTGNGFFRVPCEDGPGLCLRNNVIVATDANGFAEAQWFLYATPGVQTVEALADGVLGSPVVFSATAVVDPSTLPLTVAEVIPLNNSTNVSVSTSALVTFSRAVDPSTIDPTSLFIQSVADATKIPVAYGFTSQDSRVSLTPLVPLSPSTDYQIVSTSTIQGDIGDALTNPGTTAFETQAPPPLTIASISPPSAIPGTPVLIAGTGFANGNTVNFGNTAVTGTGTSVALTAVVPASANPGTVNVTVSNGVATSNAVPFNILLATTTVIDDVIATIGAGQSAKSIITSADGALCYAVSTEGDVVIPIGIEDQVTHPSIPVGDQPVAIVIDPAGHLAYVANFNSGSVSVIDVDPASPNFHTVPATILVGTNPLDVAVDPDGSRLAVANAGSNDVSIVDTDENSATYNQVTATIGAGQSAKSIIISADGTLYIGTSSGILVVDTSNNVTATIGAGQSAKSIITSADGSLLYIVQEDTDEVIVLAIEIIPGVGVIDPDAAASFTVRTTVAGTLQTGDDPSDIAVDPRGSGRVVVANAGDNTITVYGPGFGPITALFELNPKTLNTKSKGNYVSGLIQLPPPHSVHEIDVSTIRIFDRIYAIPGTEIFGDKNADGIADLTVLFCRAELIAVLPPNGDEVVVTVVANLGGGDDETIIGTTTLHVVRPKIFHPQHNQSVIGGQPFEITWSTPDGVNAEAVNIEWTTAPVVPAVIEDCEILAAEEEALGSMEASAEEPNVENTEDEWQTIAFSVENTGSYTWSVPFEIHPEARLRVTLVSRGNKAGESIVPFVVELPVPTRLKSFDVTIEDGAAVLRWETTLEVGMEGFAIVRSEAEQGSYRDVTEVASSGSAEGGTYEYRDEGVTGNRTYWYKLREVSQDGLGAEYGPYSVTYRVVNSLSQNHPNPFNPTTTIGYSIAKDNEV